MDASLRLALFAVLLGLLLAACPPSAHAAPDPMHPTTPTRKAGNP
jgi:hypothetical protein